MPWMVPSDLPQSNGNYYFNTSKLVDLLGQFGTWRANVNGGGFTLSNVHIATTGQIKGPAVTLDGTATSYRSIYWSTNGSARWGFTVPNTGEPGSNVGSDLFLQAFSDTGIVLRNLIGFTRSNGAMNFYNNTIDRVGAIVSRVDGPNFVFDTPSVGTRYMMWRTNGANRWSFGVNAVAEDGPNRGSDMFIGRYADNGAVLDWPLYIRREDGLVFTGPGLIVGYGPQSRIGGANLSCYTSSAAAALAVSRGPGGVNPHMTVEINGMKLKLQCIESNTTTFVGNESTHGLSLGTGNVRAMHITPTTNVVLTGTATNAAALVDPLTNLGEMYVNRLSNTQIEIRVKGTDSVVRRVVLNLT